MYRLTPRMVQSLRHDLEEYHSLFTAKRCSGWELEELICRAIRSDNQAKHHARWTEGGHDDKADITVQINGEIHELQIKSGRFVKEALVLSGHRLGRFKGDLSEISQYLNSRTSTIIAVPYSQREDKDGRHHTYQICYLPSKYLHGITAEGWQEAGAQFKQKNSLGVTFSLHPTMSWQIWWRVPKVLLEMENAFTIC